MKALVVGLARSGRAAVAALAAQDGDVVAYDRSTAVDIDGLAADVRLGAWEDNALDGVELVVKSPGVPDSAEPVVRARRRGIAVISEIELGVRLLPNPFVGITGTNGKTTTTALLGAMFEAAGMPGRGGGEHRSALDRPRRQSIRTPGWCASSRRSSSRAPTASTLGSPC